MLKKRANGIWYTNFTVSGQRIRQSTGTRDRALATNFANKLYQQKYEQSRLGVKERKTWRDAVKRFSLEKQDKVSFKDIQRHLRYLDKFVGHLYLDEITSSIAEDIIEEKLSKGAANGTINRYLTTFKSVLIRACKNYEWIDRVPSIRKLKEPKGRTRWLTKEELNSLMLALPQHAANVVRFAAMTGCRSSNVFNLKWTEVDLDRRLAWIHSDEHKNGKARSVPLNSDVMNLLEHLKSKATGPYVFTYMGRNIKSIRTALRNACEKLGYEGVTFHILRHSYASYMVQAGVSLRELQELGGWSSLSQVERYSHLSPQGLSAAQEKISLKNTAG